MYFIEITILLSASYFIRKFFVKNLTNSDEWASDFFLSMQNKSWINYNQKQSIQSGYNASPKLYFFLIRKLFKKNYKKMGAELNIIFDCMIVCVFYFYLIFYFDLNFNFSNFISDQLIFSLILSFTPLYLPVNARLIGVKARSYGNFLSFIYFLIVIHINENIFIQIFFLFVIFEIILLSSIFAIQNIIFISIIYSILTLNFVILLPLLLSLVLTIFFDYGKVRLAKHKINHIIWYYNFIDKTQVRFKNSLLSINNLIKKPSIKKITRFLLRENSFTIILINFGILIYYLYDNQIYLIELSDLNILYNQNINVLYLVFSCFIIFIFTSFGKFKIFGQSERYFEYSAPFIYIFIFGIWINTPDKLIIFYSFLINLVVIYINYLLNKKKTFHDDKEIINFLSNYSKFKKINLLCIPIKYSFKFASKIKNKKIKYYMNFISSEINGFRYMRDDLDYYNTPKKKLEYFKKKYMINYVMIENKTNIRIRYKKYLKNIVFNNNKFILFKI